MKAQDYQISSEKFVFHTTEGNLHDNKLETKPVSYFQDALHRFAKNKASILATVIIALLVVFAIVAPIFSPYEVSYSDGYYRFISPKNPMFYDLGIHFWDGGAEKEVNKATFDLYRGIQQETGRNVIMTEPKVTAEVYMGKTTELYNFRLDTYNAIGVVYKDISTKEYQAIQAYQDANGIQVIYPITDPKQRPEAEQDQNNANIWYKTKLGSGRKTAIVYDKDGNFIPIYLANDGTDQYTSKMLWEGESKQYNYAQKMDGDLWNGFDNLWRQSPLKYANNCHTPLLLIHSEEDYRCHYTEAIQMFTALKYLGVESKVCLIRGENHSLSRTGRPVQRIKRLYEILRWFDAHLKEADNG
jgi:hypothetical protein